MLDTTRATARVSDLRSGDRILTGRGIGTVSIIMKGEGLVSLTVKTNEGTLRVSLEPTTVVHLP